MKITDDFGYNEKTYRSIKVQVIGHNLDSDRFDAEYIVYVPPWEHMKDSWILTQRHIIHFKIDPKFLGDTVKFISSDHPIYKHHPAPTGERCDRCNDFFEGAERTEGKYMCRACTLNPYR